MTVAQAMLRGIWRTGESAALYNSDAFRGRPQGEIAVFYGFDAQLQEIFRVYRAAGLPVVYVDLGYWGRRHGGQMSGYHKVSVNGRHPTAYFQNHTHTRERAAQFQLAIQPWRRDGKHILLAGMSAKAAQAEGFRAEEWERRTVAQLKAVTSRPILYRPKPSYTGASQIPGTIFSKPRLPLGQVLDDCAAVVTHHSNVAVDAIVEGIPAYCVEGVAVPMAGQNLAEIEDLPRPSDRRAWLNDIAWCQFSIDEMQDGLPWRHLKNEGLIT